MWWMWTFAERGGVVCHGRWVRVGPSIEMERFLFPGRQTETRQITQSDELTGERYSEGLEG